MWGRQDPRHSRDLFLHPVSQPRFNVLSTSVLGWGVTIIGMTVLLRHSQFFYLTEASSFLHLLLSHLSSTSSEVRDITVSIACAIISFITTQAGTSIHHWSPDFESGQNGTKSDTFVTLWMFTLPARSGIVIGRV